MSDIGSQQSQEEENKVPEVSFDGASSWKDEEPPKKPEGFHNLVYQRKQLANDNTLLQNRINMMVFPTSWQEAEVRRDLLLVAHGIS